MTKFVLLLITFSCSFILLLQRLLTFFKILDLSFLPYSLLHDLHILALLCLLPKALSLKLDLPLHLITSSDVLDPIHTLIIHFNLSKILLNVILVEQFGMFEFDMQVDARKRSVYLMAVALIVAWCWFFFVYLWHYFITIMIGVWY